MEEAYYKLLNDILLGYDRTTPAKISHLRNNQIFVFGTNKYGSQKHGAAGLAAKCFGAKVGVVDGPTGMCYALPTLGFSIEELAIAVQRFEEYVRANLGYTYLVTPIGCGHAGFDVNKVAAMFKGLLGLRNVMLPEAFLKVYRKECREFFSTISSKEEFHTNIEKDEIEETLQYFDERVHKVVRYLIDNNIPFNREGGFSLQDSNGCVIAEAELGLEEEKIVFLPFDTQCEMVFVNNGYSICTPEEYLKRSK